MSNILQEENINIQDEQIPSFEEACSYIHEEIVRHLQEKCEICVDDIAYQLAVIKYEDVMQYEVKAKQVVNFLKCSLSELDEKVQECFMPRKYTMQELASIGIDIDSYTQKVKVNANILIPYLIKNRMLQIVRDYKGVFYHYTGGYWKEIPKLEVERLLREELHKIRPNIWTSRIGKECLKVLELEVKTPQELINPYNLLNTRNALIDLEKMKFYPHNDKYFTTNQLAAGYYKETECPKFKAFLKSIFPNNEKYIDLIQEILGYCLWDGTEAEKIFLWYGTGANGKSVLADVLQNLLGKDNYSTLSLEDISARFGMDAIVNKKANIATENELNLKGSSVNVQFLKKVSSGEDIYVERKFENKISHISTTKMIFLLNNLPDIKDKSEAFYRRLIIVPFMERFSINPKSKYEKPANVHLKKELAEEVDGILIFAINGLRRLKKNNFQFTIPEESQAFLEEYRIDNNAIAEFIDEIGIYEAVEERVNQKTLFNQYLAWAEQSNLKKTEAVRRVMKQIREELTKRGISYERKESNGNTYLVGINYSKNFIK